MKRDPAVQYQAARRVAGFVLLGSLVYVLLDILVQLLPPHYSPIRQAESDLGVGPYGVIMNLNFLLRGAISLGLILALRGVSTADARPKAGIFFLYLWAGCSALLAFFHTDILDGPRIVSHIHTTWHGELHLVLALIAFIAAPIGALLVSSDLKKRGLLPRIQAAAMAIAVLSLVALIAMPFFSRAHAGGLGERIFLALILAWTCTVAVSIGGTTAGTRVDVIAETGPER